MSARMDWHRAGRGLSSALPAEEPREDCSLPLVLIALLLNVFAWVGIWHLGAEMMR